MPWNGFGTYAASGDFPCVLRHARNAGQSAALCSGIAAARCDWIVTMDGDGQNDPADIPKLLAAGVRSTPAMKR
ncbi:MAG: glycosyltransferase [Chromatiales bacterium]